MGARRLPRLLIEIYLYDVELCSIMSLVGCHFSLFPCALVGAQQVVGLPDFVDTVAMDSYLQSEDVHVCEGKETIHC